MADARARSRDRSRSDRDESGDAGIGSPARTRRSARKTDADGRRFRKEILPDDGVGAVAPHRGGRGSASDDARTLMHSLRRCSHSRPVGASVPVGAVNGRTHTRRLNRGGAGMNKDASARGAPPQRAVYSRSPGEAYSGGCDVHSRADWAPRRASAPGLPGGARAVLAGPRRGDVARRRRDPDRCAIWTEGAVFPLTNYMDTPRRMRRYMDTRMFCPYSAGASSGGARESHSPTLSTPGGRVRKSLSDTFAVGRRTRKSLSDTFAGRLGPRKSLSDTFAVGRRARKSLSDTFAGRPGAFRARFSFQNGRTAH